MRKPTGYKTGIGRHCDFCRHCHCMMSKLTQSGRMSPEIRRCRKYGMRVAWDGTCGNFEHRTSVSDRSDTANDCGQSRREAAYYAPLGSPSSSEGKA